MPPPKQGFISYSHVDHAAFERLLAHLKAVGNLYGFRFWHDRRIKAGSYWNPDIQQAIADSDVFVCLTTNDFFASDYIYAHELPAIIKARKDRKALIVPVILQECAWRGFFGSYIEVVPKDARHNLKPVRRWPDREHGYAVAANAVGDAVADWFGIAPASPLSPLASAAGIGSKP